MSEDESNEQLVGVPLFGTDGQQKTPQVALQAAWGVSSMLESAKGRNRTDDTSIFSAVLYQLSYLGDVNYYSMSCPLRQALHTGEFSF
jgi:hypothetical protein